MTQDLQMCKDIESAHLRSAQRRFAHDCARTAEFISGFAGMHTCVNGRRISHRFLTDTSGSIMHMDYFCALKDHAAGDGDLKAPYYTLTSDHRHIIALITPKD